DGSRKACRGHLFRRPRPGRNLAHHRRRAGTRNRRQDGGGHGSEPVYSLAGWFLPGSAPLLPRWEKGATRPAAYFPFTARRITSSRIALKSSGLSRPISRASTLVSSVASGG